MRALDTDKVIVRLLLDHAGQREMPTENLVNLVKKSRLRGVGSYSWADLENDIQLLESLGYLISYQEDGQVVAKLTPAGHRLARQLEIK